MVGQTRQKMSDCLLWIRGQSGLGMHGLSFNLHLLGTFPYFTVLLFDFRMITAKFSSVRKLMTFTVPTGCCSSFTVSADRSALGYARAKDDQRCNDECTTENYAYNSPGRQVTVSAVSDIAET